MRRPPDKDRSNAVLTESDILSSNSTLNTMFGGAHQKSWMRGPSNPVRPTPRPSISKNTRAQTHTQTIIAGTGSHILPSPAPSDEASPVLSHVPINHSHLETLREPQTNESYPNAALMNGSGQVQPNPSIETFVSDFVAMRSTYRETTPSSANDQQATGTTSPVPKTTAGLRTAQSSRASTVARQSLPQETVLGSPQVEPRGLSHIQVPQRQSPRLLQAPLIETSSGAPSTMISDARGDHRRRQAATTDSNPTAQSPVPLPSTLLHRSQEHPNSSTVYARPYKRQRTQGPVTPSLKPRLHMIEKQLQTLRLIPGWEVMLEVPRYTLLAEACMTDDAFYVALHQIFCVWDLPNPTLIASIPEFPSSTVLLISFKIMGQLIRENDALGYGHKQWFSEFPSPLPILLKGSEAYRRVIREVGIFLGKLNTEWVNLSSACSHRRYPPLVDELVGQLGLLSPTLQQIAFTAVRRNLGIPDDGFGQQMESLFKKDCQGHQALSARYNTALRPTQKEIDDRNVTLANEYLVLHKDMLQYRDRPVATSASPISRFPTPATFQNNASYQTGAPPPGIIQQRDTSGPEIAAQRQTPAIITVQHPEHARVSSVASPNMAAPVSAGRSGSVPSQQAYQSASRPAISEGLSRQSSGAPQVRFVANFVPTTNGVMYRPQYQTPQHPPMSLQQFQIMQQRQCLQQTPGIQWNEPNLPPTMLPQHFHQQNAQQQHVIQQQQQVLRQQQIYEQQMANPQVGRDITPMVDLQHNAHPRNNNRNNSVSISGRRTSVINPISAQSPRGSLHLEQISRNALAAGLQTATQQQRLIQLPNNVIFRDRRLLPDPKMPQQPHVINPDQTSLHQAHIRSPCLMISTISQVEKPQDKPEYRHYQVVKEFAFGPAQLNNDLALNRFEFEISGDHFARLPMDYYQDKTTLRTRRLERSTLQYRLRCIQTKTNVTSCLLPDWVVSDTSWPEGSFLSINRQQLEIRRKYHHGKDLPIDITQNLLSIGVNTKSEITVSIPKSRPKVSAFFFAVEVVELLPHNQILEMIHAQRIPASETLNEIRNKLAPIEDDDFAMVVSDLSLELTDPFTALIYEVPVRSKHCLHRECFDLETFLLTRNSKAKRPQQPCMPDVWKCPLCGKDSRPYELHIDDFLVSVRAELASKDDLDVKAILISPDGTWKPKREPTGERKATTDPYIDDDSDNDGPSQPNTSTAPPLKKAVEIIELDDD